MIYSLNGRIRVLNKNLNPSLVLFSNWFDKVVEKSSKGESQNTSVHWGSGGALWYLNSVKFSSLSSKYIINFKSQLIVFSCVCLEVNHIHQCIKPSSVLFRERKRTPWKAKCHFLCLFFAFSFFALDLNFILNKMDTERKQADDKGRENV